MIKKIEVIVHYEEDDIQCHGDYTGVDVVIDGEVIKEYSDYYHDKGLEKANAFIEGIVYMYTILNIPFHMPDYKRINDGKVNV